MKVSIIIPVYNVEPYITECLKSVAKQTYTGHLECLIIDDCATDDSIKKAENFIHSYAGNIVFRIIHHTHNRGLSAARNTGIQESTGDYVYFLDSDDAIIPETIELMVNVVIKQPNIAMVQGGIMNKANQITSNFAQMGLPTYTDNKEWIINNMLNILPVSSWNRLLKKESLIKKHISFHEGIIHEDVPFNFQLSLKINSVGFICQNTYMYRQGRGNSILNSTDEVCSLQSRFIIMEECISTYQDHHFESKKLKTIAFRYLWEKWLTYMRIHKYATLSANRKEITAISRKMVSITPWPLRIFAYQYMKLPLRLRRIFL